MGTETACGSYFNDPPGEPRMASYYQINERSSGGGPANQQEEEMAPQNCGGEATEQVDSELDLRQPQLQQQEQQRHHAASPRNHWSISQQIQNHLSQNNVGSASSRLERSNSLASNWTFPNYQRLYNENHYGIAIAAAQNQQHQQQQHQIQHDGQLQQQHQQQQHQQHQHQHQHQQQQQHHQHHLTAMTGGGMPQPSGGGHPHLSKRFFYPATGQWQAPKLQGCRHFVVVTRRYD